jgi:hypothetical protein
MALKSSKKVNGYIIPLFTVFNFFEIGVICVICGYYFLA